MKKVSVSEAADYREYIRPENPSITALIESVPSLVETFY